MKSNYKSTLLFVSAIFLFLQLALCKPNNAPYINAQKRPLNIAHRGLCSLFPENTLQSFSAALYQGADFIQLDVVYTQEKIPLVMHDPFLTRITDILKHSQFATRYETRKYNGKDKRDWWTDNFTLNQLKRLTIKQDQAPGRLTIFDYLFTFPTLDEVIQMVINFNKQHQGKRNPDGRLGGILIEAKDSQMYRDLYGLEIGETILNTLKKHGIETIQKAKNICPIYLHSFDYGSVKYWGMNTQLPVNYLLFNNQPFNLTDINLYATGIGFQDGILWDYKNNKTSPVLQQTKDLGLKAHVWTFKDDVLLFSSQNNLKMYKIAQMEMKLDGVITQFSDIYSPVAQLYRKEMYPQICHLRSEI